MGKNRLDYKFIIDSYQRLGQQNNQLFRQKTHYFALNFHLTVE